jgi:hypothetical protein
MHFRMFAAFAGLILTASYMGESRLARMFEHLSLGAGLPLLAPQVAQASGGWYGVSNAFCEPS